MSGIWDMNEDRSGDNLFLGINKTIYLMGEDRISDIIKRTCSCVCSGRWFELNMVCGCGTY